MRYPNAIDTARHRIRPLAMGDLEDFYAYAKVPGVGEAAGWPHHTSVDMSRRILEKMCAWGGEFAIVARPENRMIGTIGVYAAEPLFAPYLPPETSLEESVEIGYVLSKDYWGAGRMQECIRAMTQALFCEGYRAVFASVRTENARSQRVLDAVGFSLAGTDIHPGDSREYYIYCATAEGRSHEEK